MDSDGFSPACDAILTDGPHACGAICPSIMIVIRGLILGLILRAKCSREAVPKYRIQICLSGYK